MFDAFILMAPLLILPIVLLLVFVGCNGRTGPRVPDQRRTIKLRLDNIAQSYVRTVKFTVHITRTADPGSRSVPEASIRYDRFSHTFSSFTTTVGDTITHVETLYGPSPHSHLKSLEVTITGVIPGGWSVDCNTEEETGPAFHALHPERGEHLGWAVEIDTFKFELQGDLRVPGDLRLVAVP